jgi:type IV pilus assembly protein PilC
MSYDELAFFNQQLGAMLREGIPLEAALKQLSAGMGTGAFRTELEHLQQDLARGTPLPDALKRRSLPPFYVRMLEIGVRGNDLPGMLTLLADYYQRANALWSRLKGLMVYPVLVIIVSLGLTLVLSLAFRRFLTEFFDQFTLSPFLLTSLWIPPIFLTLTAIVLITVLSIPDWRARVRWRLPGFREASLSQLASAMALMLRKGATLTEALAQAEALEPAMPVAKTLAQWRLLLEAGHGKPAQWPAGDRPFPPLFLWLVRQGGEDLAAGFQKAADLYQQRAAYRTELLLYGALPVSILLLAQMVFWQAAPLFRSLSWLMQTLGG